MNDRTALRVADKLEIHSVSVPAFLLLYRALGDEAVSLVRKLVVDLEEKDYYGFSEEMRRLLLGEPRRE